MSKSEDNPWATWKPYAAIAVILYGGWKLLSLNNLLPAGLSSTASATSASLLGQWHCGDYQIIFSKDGNYRVDSRASGTQLGTYNLAAGVYSVHIDYSYFDARSSMTPLQFTLLLSGLTQQGQWETARRLSQTGMYIINPDSRSQADVLQLGTDTFVYKIAEQTNGGRDNPESVGKTVTCNRTQ